MTELLDAALMCHALGWSIIPILYRQKKATIRWKPFQKRRPSETQLRAWFGNGSPSNMAVVLGPVSGDLACRDFDVAESYHAWAAAHPDLAQRLPTAKTGRGFHVYYRAAGASTTKCGDGELRGGPNYCVLSPSVHPNGRPYEWVVPPTAENLCVIDPMEAGLSSILDKTREFSEEAEESEDTEAMYGVSSESSQSSGSSPSSQSSENTQDLSPLLAEKIEEAIRNTLPAKEGQRNRCILRFCQRLKGIPELANLSLAQLKPIARKWHAKAYPTIGTKPFDATWEDFVHAWPRVKWPKGVVFDAAVQRAREDTEHPPEAAAYEDPLTQLLVRICWQLQQWWRDEPFYLAQRQAAEVLGICQPCAGKKLEMLMADGILAFAQAHTATRATRYKYVGESLGKESR